MRRTSERGQGIVEIGMWLVAGAVVIGVAVFAVRWANARGDKPLTPEEQAYVQAVAMQQAAAYIAAVATQEAEAANAAPPPPAPPAQAGAPQQSAPVAPAAPPPAPAAPPPPPPAAPTVAQPPAPPVAAPTSPPPPPPTVPPPPAPTITRDDIVAYFGGAGEAHCIADEMLATFSLAEISQMGIEAAADAIPDSIEYCIQKFKPDGL